MPNKSFDYIPLIRSNYFPGLYILETDLEEQRNYLDARQKYHRQCLYISGIIEGLEVIPVPGQTQVGIGAGTAVDDQGNLIVLSKDRLNFEVASQGIQSGDLYIQWQCESEPNPEPVTDENDPFARPPWSEEPAITFASATPSGAVTLAKLSLSEGGVKLDFSTRQSSGLKLPSPGGKLALGYQGNFQEPGESQIETATLAGSLSVTGSLSVAGSTTIGDLHITNPQDFQIDLQGTAEESTEGDTNEIKVNGVSVITDALRQRGLNTVILQPDGSIRGSQNHDVHISADAWNLWANWIVDTAQDGDAIAVTSHDALSPVPPGGVAEALLQSVNAKQVFTLGLVQSSFTRIPYALLFIKGQQYGTKEISMPYRGGHARITAQYRKMASQVIFPGVISAGQFKGNNLFITDTSTLTGKVTVRPTLTATAGDTTLTAVHIKPTFTADSTITGTKKNGLIVEDGNVGIGTTVPEARLEVNGNMKASDVTITGSLTIGSSVGDIDVATALAGKANTADVNNALASKASLKGSLEQDFAAKQLSVQSLSIGGVDIATVLADKARKNGTTAEDFNARHLTITGNLEIGGDGNHGNISITYYRDGYQCCLGPVIPEDAKARDQWVRNLWDRTVQSWGERDSNRPQSMRDAGINENDLIDTAQYVIHQVQGWNLNILWNLSYRIPREDGEVMTQTDVWILHPANQLPASTKFGWSIVQPDGIVVTNW